MTAYELREYLNRVYGLSNQWPESFEIDLNTYNDVAKELLLWYEQRNVVSDIENIKRAIELKKPIMFKNVKLILNNKLNR